MEILVTNVFADLILSICLHLMQYDTNRVFRNESEKFSTFYGIKISVIENKLYLLFHDLRNKKKSC